MPRQVEDTDLLPLLAAGKHRNPRKGACFMELASHLAGERWSDSPACTHPLLAAVARTVNDAISSEARPKLAVLVPSVIGLNSQDPRWDHEIALLAACAAIPVAAADRQGALAVGIIVCEDALAVLDERDRGDLRASSRAALASAPQAHTWARRFISRSTTRHAQSHRNPAPAIVELAARGLAQACVPDRDERLYNVLVDVIERCRALAGFAAAAEALQPGDWLDICQPASPEHD